MKFVRDIALSTAVMVFGTFVALAVVEGGFRLFGPKPAGGPTWSDRPAFYVAPEGSRTLRDYVYSPSKRRGDFRVAVVGDSFTFAPYIQFYDTFPKRLETMLNLNRLDQRAEVINYGIPAYSTHHEVAVVDQVLKEGADLVLLQITLNDPELKPYRPTGLTGMPDRFGAYESQPWQRMLFRFSKSAEFVAQRLHNASTHDAYKEYFLDLYRRDARPWRVFEASLRRIVANARGSNRRIAAVVFPLFGTPLDETYPFSPAHEKLDALLTELKVKHLDLLEAYRGLPVDRLQVIPGIDRHPNEIGHRIAAEHIYQWLTKQRIVPEKFAAKQVYKERIGVSGLEPLNEEAVEEAQQEVESPGGAESIAPAAAPNERTSD